MFGSEQIIHWGAFCDLTTMKDLTKFQFQIFVDFRHAFDEAWSSLLHFSLPFANFFLILPQSPQQPQ